MNRPLVITRGYGTSAAANYATFVYTADGLAQSVEDAKSNLTYTTYDGFNRAIQVNFPVITAGQGQPDPANFETYGYDANGNVTSRRLRSGDTLGFTYDALNRVTLKQYSNTTLNQNIYLGYDLLNRALYARFGSATGAGVTNVYDALSRVKSTTDSNGRVLQYSYDAAGDRTQVTWPDGGANALAVQYAYDNLQRVTAITENSSYTLAGFAYDALGRRTTLSRGPGGGLASTGYGYDGLDRLTGLSQSFANTGNNLTLGLTPSPSDQLAGKSFSNLSYAYAPPAASTSYSANGLNQYSAVAGTSYSYDGRGNLTSDGTRAFTYDLDNHLLTGSAPTPVSLTYDPLGRLQTSTASGATTNFLYDGATLVAEYDNSGNILNRYVPGPGTDEPLVWYAGTGTTSRRWLHADDLGSIIGWSDTTGTSQLIQGYDPFGQPGSAWTGPRYSYTGQLMIPEAHLYNYKARVYDPGLGRFLQTDPAGYASDINAYAYATNDPVNRSDPSGMLECIGDSDGRDFGDDIICYNNTIPFPVYTGPSGSPGGFVVPAVPPRTPATTPTPTPMTQRARSPGCTQLQAQAAQIGRQLSVLSSALSTAAGFGGLTSALLGVGELAGGLDTPLTASAVAATGSLASGALVTGLAAGSLKSFAANSFSPLATEAFNQLASAAAGFAGTPLTQAAGLGNISDELSDLAARALSIAEREQSECS